MHHDTRFNNDFAFSSFGKIIIACINHPSSWHDANVSVALARKVIKDLDPYAFCVDKGFPTSGDLYGRFLGPYSKTVRRLAPNLKKQLLDQANVYTSLRQASEWKVRALQGTFSRLTTASRAILLLHILRTDLMGLNQIAAILNPEYEQYIVLEGYDRISRYFYNDDNCITDEE